MNNQITEIKREQKNWFNKGIAFLAVMLISLFLALFPFISDVNIELQIFLHLFGGILFLVFATLFAILLYFEINPKTAIKFTNKGFIDIINIGENIEIEWTNISAVKVLGKENVKFLGITLENPDIVIAQMKKNKAAEIIENIEQNLPTILIPQNTVRIAIKELKSIIIKSVKDARLLESEAPKKAKTNPFTTEDVLRAFGQLPKEEPTVVEEPNYTNENDEPETVVEENNDIINRDVNEEEIDIINESELTEETFTREATDSTETNENVEMPNINIIEPTTNKEATADADDVEIIISNNKVSQPFSIPEEIKPTNTTANYVSAS
ncbi:MAG: hypothetical protein IKU23_08030, partial [Clostridia bacterium]|nr:hypothetical protein [Clostridia bacterium]